MSIAEHKDFKKRQDLTVTALQELTEEARSDNIACLCYVVIRKDSTVSNGRVFYNGFELLALSGATQLLIQSMNTEFEKLASMKDGSKGDAE